MKVKATRAKKATPRTKTRNTFEQKALAYLDSVGAEYEYEGEFISYTVPEKNRRYKPDIKLANGIYCELKGYYDRKAVEKMELVLAQHIDKDIRFVFQADNRMPGRKTMRYSDWARKHDVVFAIDKEGKIPLTWIHEKPRTG